MLSQHNENAVVSVIMNCYNGQEYLREAIDSVINQTYPHWELIFWDNQSTDESSKIVKSYSDNRIKYYYSPIHTKLYPGRNLALEKINGRYIAFLDTDDVWHPDKLNENIAILNKKEYSLVSSNYYLINRQSKILKRAIRFNKKSGHITGELINDYYIGILTVVLDRKLLKSEEKPFSENFNHVGDFDLFLRLSEDNKIYYDSRTLAYYRIHENNLSSKKSLELLREIKVMERTLEKRDFYKKQKHLIQNLILVRKYLLFKQFIVKGRHIPLMELVSLFVRKPIFFVKLIVLVFLHFLHLS
ncbi:glycosyltransferase [Leptospira perdikensis]|uniref:Glycosyltransferase n=1 Tax=Leptospira perdikensis TaxID=2484948 RepID=A0A4R9JLX9_9LEPT|nr:glycosyltransferase [Leptospira perdikensis]TGL45811.1 glycosyltransferase [Leptospira perdikensis]